MWIGGSFIFGGGVIGLAMFGIYQIYQCFFNEPQKNAELIPLTVQTVLQKESKDLEGNRTIVLDDGKLSYTERKSAKTNRKYVVIHMEGKPDKIWGSSWSDTTLEDVRNAGLIDYLADRKKYENFYPRSNPNDRLILDERKYEGLSAAVSRNSGVIVDENDHENFSAKSNVDKANFERFKQMAQELIGSNFTPPAIKLVELEESIDGDN